MRYRKVDLSLRYREGSVEGPETLHCMFINVNRAMSGVWSSIKLESNSDCFLFFLYASQLSKMLVFMSSKLFRLQGLSYIQVLF